MTTETYKYDVETESLMSTIINAVYSDRSHFLRELISNASDAIDKMTACFASYREKGLIENMRPAEIHVIPHKEQKILVIEDSGIGMTKADLVNFIGKIASSGTKQFKQMMKEQGASVNAENLIGQFGLGFYSGFLVADKMEVVTHNVEDEQYVWSSKGLGDFEIRQDEGEKMAHGTRLVLYIKDGCEEYLESSKLKELIKKYSLFISYPIFVHEEKEVEEEVKEDEGKDESKVEEVKEEKDEAKEDEEPVISQEKTKEREVKKKKIIEKVQVNKKKPLWCRNPKDVTQEEYAEFYKTISNDWDTHMAVKHSSLEGTINFKVVLFFPKKCRFSMFEKNAKKNHIKLYSQNVFVTDNLEESIPDWMNFVAGVVASDDLPMNVSREFLQGKNTMKLIKKILTKKTLELMNDLAADPVKYKEFYSEFSTNVKLAVREDDSGNQEKFARLLRYETTKSNGELIDLETYVKNMKEGQKQIFVVTGITRNEVVGNPFLSAFSDYEVIYMYEAVDEIMLQGLRRYKEFEIQRITSEGVDIGKKADEETVKSYEGLTKRIQETLSEKIEKVVLNINLKTPCAIASTKYGHSAAMETIIRSQPGAENNPFLQMMGMSKKVFEINPENPIIKNLNNTTEYELFKSQLQVLYDTACLQCGYKLDSASQYAENVFKFMEKNLGPEETKVEEVE